MKKFSFILLISVLTLIGANTANAQVRWPSGNPTFSTISRTAKQVRDTVTANNSYTYLDLGTMDTNLTVDVTIGSKVKAGDFLFLVAASDATARSLTFGNNIDGAVLSGTISKTKTVWFIYNGTKFVIFGSAQVD